MSGEFRAEYGSLADKFELLTIYPEYDGGVLVRAIDNATRAKDARSAFVRLPAADARRLLAWLRERYPETENENG